MLESSGISELIIVQRHATHEKGIGEIATRQALAMQAIVRSRLNRRFVASNGHSATSAPLDWSSTKRSFGLRITNGANGVNEQFSDGRFPGPRDRKVIASIEDAEVTKQILVHICYGVVKNQTPYEPKIVQA